MLLARLRLGLSPLLFLVQGLEPQCIAFPREIPRKQSPPDPMLLLVAMETPSGLRPLILCRDASRSCQGGFEGGTG